MSQSLDAIAHQYRPSLDIAPTASTSFQTQTYAQVDRYCGPGQDVFCLQALRSGILFVGILQ